MIEISCEGGSHPRQHEPRGTGAAAVASVHLGRLRLQAKDEAGARALWEEFEAKETPEARFAGSVDRLAPLLLNHATAGRSWREHGITVIDGGCRDIELVLAEEFPVFCRYRTPADAVARWRIEHWNTPVTVGAVRVEPGDYVVADRDGIVAIPAALLDEVIERAEVIVATENEIRTAVRAGVAPLEAYERYGIF